MSSIILFLDIIGTSSQTCVSRLNYSQIIILIKSISITSLLSEDDLTIVVCTNSHRNNSVKGSIRSNKDFVHESSVITLATMQVLNGDFIQTTCQRVEQNGVPRSRLMIRNILNLHNRTINRSFNTSQGNHIILRNVVHTDNTVIAITHRVRPNSVVNVVTLIPNSEISALSDDTMIICVSSSNSQSVSNIAGNIFGYEVLTRHIKDIVHTDNRISQSVNSPFPSRSSAKVGTCSFKCILTIHNLFIASSNEFSINRNGRIISRFQSIHISSVRLTTRIADDNHHLLNSGVESIASSRNLNIPIGVSLDFREEITIISNHIGSDFVLEVRNDKSTTISNSNSRVAQLTDESRTVGCNMEHSVSATDTTEVVFNSKINMIQSIAPFRDNSNPSRNSVNQLIHTLTSPGVIVFRNMLILQFSRIDKLSSHSQVAVCRTIRLSSAIANISIDLHHRKRSDSNENCIRNGRTSVTIGNSHHECIVTTTIEEFNFSLRSISVRETNRSAVCFAPSVSIRKDRTSNRIINDSSRIKEE